MVRAARLISLSISALVVIVNACAGIAENDPREGRAGRAGGAADASVDARGGAGGAGGSIDSGSAIDRCMVPLAGKSCNLAGCHGAQMASAGLRLTEDVVMEPASLVDRPNAGDMNGCAAGMFKLIDRAEPEKSLLYRKVTGTPPCGVKMPVGPALTSAETACILSWIKSAVK